MVDGDHGDDDDDDDDDDEKSNYNYQHQTMMVVDGFADGGGFGVAQAKEELEENLDESQRLLDESRSYIGQLRSQQKEEKRERAL